MADVTTPGPGMVTSNVVGSTYTAQTPQEQARMWQLEDRKKAEQDARNAQIRAENAAKQRAAGEAQEQIKLRAAFNAMYGPQIAAKGHDIRMSENSPEGRQLRQQYERLPGGAWASGTAYQTGAMPHFDYDQNQVNQILDQMWRQQTDPYYKAAAQMGGGTLKAMTPGGTVGGGSKRS